MNRLRKLEKNGYGTCISVCVHTRTCVSAMAATATAKGVQRIEATPAQAHVPLCLRVRGVQNCKTAAIARVIVCVIFDMRVRGSGCTVARTWGCTVAESARWRRLGDARWRNLR